MKILLFFILIFLASCVTRPLYKTGNYIIKTRTGNVTTFHHVKGSYELISDTLKVGDTVLMINIKKKS